LPQFGWLESVQGGSFIGSGFTTSQDNEIVSDEAQETRPKRLTPKQAAFVQEYLVDLNATQAAIRAGYSEDTAHSIGHENLSKPEVAEAIQDAMDHRATRVGISADFVLSTVVDTIRRCGQATPVLDKRGEPVMTETPTGVLAPAYAFDAKSVLKGCELLGKHLKLFADRVEHTGKDGAPIETKIDDHDLARRLAFLLDRGASEK
jgi:phage terminase small subunit